MAKAAVRKKKQAAVSLDFAFFNSLTNFQRVNRGALRRRYRDLTKKFLDFNDPGEDESEAYLRRPQFEALETYVFLKGVADKRMSISCSKNGRRTKASSTVSSPRG